MQSRRTSVSEATMGTSSFGALAKCVVFVLLLCVLALVRGSAVDAWKESTNSYFSRREGDASSIVPFSVMAVADLTNEIHMDLIGVFPNRSGLYVACYNEKKLSYEPCWQLPSYTEEEDSQQPSFAVGDIVSVLVADIQRDGVLDYMVQLKNGTVLLVDRSSSPDNATVEVLFAYSTPGGGGSIAGGILPEYDSSIPQLAVVNIFSASGYPEFALTRSSDSSLVVMRNVGKPPNTAVSRTSSSSSDGYTYVETVLHQGIPNDEEVVPMSMASEDLDGNCIPEVLYTVRKVQENRLDVYAAFLSVDDSVTEEKSKTGSLGAAYDTKKVLLSLSPASSYGIPSFFDINGDGAPDIIVPTCSAAVSSCENGFDTLEVYVSVSGGNGKTSSSCPSSSCCSGHPYGFEESGSYVEPLVFSLDRTSCNVPKSDGSTAPILMPHSKTSPLLVRFGDSNRDGYADVVVPSEVGPLVLVANSVLFSQRAVGSALNKKNMKPFLSCSMLDSSQPLDATGADRGYLDATPFFVDVDDDGTLDVMLTHLGTSDQSSQYSPMVYINDEQLQERYFFTASTVNGATNAYGVFRVAATHRFQWQDINMQYRFASTTQLSRTQAHALMSPRSYFGLDHTFSYIQDYATGMVVSSSSKYKQWSSYLIPNSQVIALTNPLNQPARWALRLYLSSYTRYQELLVVVMCIVLTLIGIPIVVLKIKEIRQDRREMKRR